MGLLPGTKNEIMQHIEAGFSDAKCAESLNLNGFTTARGKPWTVSGFSYYRQKFGIKKPGGHLTKRRRARIAQNNETRAEPRAKALVATPTTSKLKDACVALLDCAPAQRGERIELVFQLLGVK